MAPMASKEPKQFAGRKVTKCPLPYCPAPNLFVAKKGTRRHCIGCWRKFTAGVARLSRTARQKRPSKSLLRLYSPQQSADGPPPVLLYPKLEVRPSADGPITDPKRPPPASIVGENNYSRPVTTPTTSVESEYDDDVISTGRWAGASAPDEYDDDVISTARWAGASAPGEQSCADSLESTGSRRRCAPASTPDLLAIEIPEVHFPADDYSQFYTDMTRDEDSEKISVGSVPDEYLADGPTCTESKSELTSL